MKKRKVSNSTPFALDDLMLLNSVTLDSKPLEIEGFNYTEFGIIRFCVRDSDPLGTRLA